MDQTSAAMVRCARCGTKNRVPAAQSGRDVKCGKCGFALDTTSRNSRSYVLRCTVCHTRNRIPQAKLRDEAKCGKCSSTLKTEVISAPQPVTVTDNNFDSEVVESPLPVLLFAWAPWCPTCRSAMPVVDDFAQESKGKVRVGKLNVDTNPFLSSKYNILSVPQLFVFDAGELKETLPGTMPKHDIMFAMARFL
jgi:thioredoxin 2